MVSRIYNSVPRINQRAYSKRTESSVWQRALWTHASTLFLRQLFRRAIICKPYFVYIPILRKERQGQCVKTSLRCLPLVSYGRVTATCRGQISRSRERNGSRAARTCQEWKRSSTGSRMDHPLTVGGILANCWGIDFPQNDAEN